MKPIIIGGLVVFIIIVLLVVVIPFIFGVEFRGPDAGPQLHGFFVSSDGGVSWESRNDIKDSRSKLSGLTITDFVIHPKERGHFFVGTTNSGIWRSKDEGKSWKKIIDKAGILKSGAEILRIAVSESNPKIWYVAAYQQNRGSLLKSDDGGESFREVYFVPVERFGVFDVWIDEPGRSVFVVTGQGGFLESKDGGKSWRVVRWFQDGIVRLIPDPRSFSTLYLLASKGKMFKTADRGSTWTDLTSHFNSFDRSSRNQNLVTDSLSGALFLSSDYGLIRSLDGGFSWDRVPVIIPPEALPVLTTAVHPFDSRTFFISAQSQIYKTEDGGITWSIIPSPTNRRITKLVIDQKNPKMIYLVSSR